MAVIKESVGQDFEKYRDAIKSSYQHYYGKRLAYSLILLALLITLIMLVPLTSLKVLFFILGAPVVLLLLIKNYQYYRQFEMYFSGIKADWEKKINQLNFEDEDNLIYEDTDNYYVKEVKNVRRFLKKGSRSFPSENRGLTLIVAENSDLFTANQPLLVAYCDITEIKMFNLVAANEKSLRQMRMTRLKNKLVPPLLVGVIIVLVLLYLF